MPFGQAYGAGKLAQKVAELFTNDSKTSQAVQQCVSHIVGVATLDVGGMAATIVDIAHQQKKERQKRPA